MVKKISVVALAGLLALPAVALAQPADRLEQRIEALTRELGELRAQMQEMKEANAEMAEEFEEKAERWDAGSRFEISGDLRNRLDFHWAKTAEGWAATDVAQGVVIFQRLGDAINGAAQFSGFDANSPLGVVLTDATFQSVANAGLAGAPELGAAYNAMNTNAETSAALTQMAMGGATLGQFLGMLSSPENIANFMRGLSPAARQEIFTSMIKADGTAFSTAPSKKYEEDNGLWSTRLRLNLRAKATENVEFKGRLVAYKAWGIQHNPMDEEATGVDSPYFLNSRTFDGTVGRKPVDSNLVLDRAFMNWNNIGGLPVWFSIGRRPTTDGPPAHLRMGVDERLATPVAFMDYPFDGISVGYAYRDLFGLTDAPGRIRFCYGRGFEAGPQEKNTGINDVDFMGLSWDIYQKGSRFANIQSFAATNLFNVPGDTFFPNPIELAQNEILGTNHNGFLDRTNLGNVYHTSGVYMDKVQNLNYFLALGWSHTDPKGMDELGNSLLSDFWEPLEKKDGYAVYTGVRYDLDNYRLKFGAEYNYGSKNWLGFTPGHDDMYTSKLWTRGSAYEVHTIWDIPAGEAISKFGSAFIRLGYQHINFDYTYSGMWLGTPTKIDDIKNDPLEAQFYPQFDKVNQVYLTLEAWF
jgi:hypothetical protein